MKRLSLLIFVILAMIAVAPISAQDDETGDTLLDYFTGNNDFSTLVAAVEAADPAVLDALAGGGPLTIFAPTNEAFANLALEFDFELEAILADSDLVTELLLYHVVPGELLSTDLIALDGDIVIPLLPDSAFSVEVDDTGLQLNGIVRVIEPFDLPLSNGIVHTLADVIYPLGFEERLAALSGAVTADDTAATEDEATDTEAMDDIESMAEDDEMTEAESMDDDMMTPTSFPDLISTDNVPELPETPLIVDLVFPTEQTLAARIVSDPRYDVLEGVLLDVAPDFVDIVNDFDIEYTVLAPTNSAFDNLFFTLGITYEEALQQPELLRAILAYHIIPGRVSADDIRALDGERVDTIFDNGQFVESISISTRRSIIILNGVVQVKSSDRQTLNGFIHSVDNVLIPQYAIDALADLGIVVETDE